MRKFSLFLLLASAAAPALAAPGDDDRGGGRHHRGGESSEQSDSRPQRASSNSGGGEQRSLRSERAESDRSQSGQQARMERIRERFEAQRQQSATSQESGGGDDTTVRSWRRGTDSTSGTQSTWRPRERQVRTIPDTNAVSQQQQQQREAFQSRHRRDYRDGNYTRWTNNWRHDRRYDWYNYRNRHRSIFRIGLYYDPFGWNYRRWSIGSFLYPSYYGSSFWLNDPWQYRLPPAYGPYRWVRYWDDALLVNIYTGEVVDVINNFFW